MFYHFLKNLKPHIDRICQKYFAFGLMAERIDSMQDEIIKFAETVDGVNEEVILKRINNRMKSKYEPNPNDSKKKYQPVDLVSDPFSDSFDDYSILSDESSCFEFSSDIDEDDL